MDKIYTMALILMVMVLSISLRVHLDNMRQRTDIEFSSASIVTHVVDDYRRPQTMLFAEHNLGGTSSQILQTPSKKLLPWDLLFTALTLEEVKELKSNERNYYSVVSKFPQIYIVPSGERRGPPSIQTSGTV